MNISEESVKQNLELAQKQQQEAENQHQSDKIHYQSKDDPTAKNHVNNISNKNKIYISYGQGLRPYQEDRYQLDNIIIPQQQSPQQLAECLYKSVIRVGQDCRRMDSGSALTIFLLHSNYLITANVGDSRVMLVFKKGNKYYCRRLTWDHKPTEDIEHKRIESEGGRVVRVDIWRLNGVLAMSRAIGDASVGPGLSYEPSISWIDLSEYKDEKFILTCSDGIVDLMDEIDIADIFNQGIPINTVADAIRKEGYLCGSTDNMTLIVAPVIQDKQNNEAVIGLVADGHGGSAVAEYIKNHFVEIISGEIKNFEGA